MSIMMKTRKEAIDALAGEVDRKVIEAAFALAEPRAADIVMMMPIGAETEAVKEYVVRAMVSMFVTGWMAFADVVDAAPVLPVQVVRLGE